MLFSVIENRLRDPRLTHNLATTIADVDYGDDPAIVPSRIGPPSPIPRLCCILCWRHWSRHKRRKHDQLQSSILYTSIGLETGWSWVRIPQRQLRFGTLAIPFTPLCQCRSEETIKAVGPFYIYGVYARGSKRSHQSALEMCNFCRGQLFKPLDPYCVSPKMSCLDT